MLVHLVRFVRQESPVALKLIFGMAAVSGLATIGVLGLINTVAEQVSLGEPISFRHFLLYILAVALYWVTTQEALTRTNRLVEGRLNRIRMSIAEKLAGTELKVLEGIGRGDLYTKFSHECQNLAQLFPILVNSCQLAVLVFFSAFYLALISLPALLVLLAVTAGGAVVFLRHRQAMNEAMRTVTETEALTLDTLAHFVEGFQEIRLHAGRNDSLFARFTEVVDELRRRLVGIGDDWAMLLMFANVYIYGLLGGFVFLLPLALDGYSDTVHKVVAVSLFCAAPIANMLFVAPMFTKAEVSLAHIENLERMLLSGPQLEAEAMQTLVPMLESFQKVEYRGLLFSYRDSDGDPTFTTGPWSLTLRRGELIFITGGNGSGKSTLLKLLTNLYQPDQGQIAVDGENLDEHQRLALRELFSCIFGDFHLFDRLYGLEEVEVEEVDRLLAKMELSDKVTYSEGRFSELSLSTGQRKRLALIAALLEDRPIYIFDEWAADQDAQFRERFYTEILPELKKRGKTVVAVTHDDHFWHTCDRRIHLDLGTVVEDFIEPSKAGP